MDSMDINDFLALVKASKFRILPPDTFNIVGLHINQFIVIIQKRPSTFLG
jgi:hypothetical protein